MARPVLGLALAAVLTATAPVAASADPVHAASPAVVSVATATPSDPQVTSLTLTPQQITVSGVSTAPLTVEVAFRQTSADPFPPTPTRVVLRPVSVPRPLPIPPILSIVTPRASGTDTDGVWRGAIPVPSSASGLWRVDCVMLSNARCLVPTQRPTVRINGTHSPSLSVAMRPYPIQLSGTVTVSGRLTDSSTGRGVPGREIVVALHRQTCTFESTSCSGESLYGLFTDPWGRFSSTVSTNQAPRLCVVATIPGTHSLDQDAPTLATDCRSIRHVIRVSAASAVTRVRIDGVVRVSGRVAPGPVTGQSSLASGAVIQLQRLTGGVWRTVSSTRVEPNGTYRLGARADARGGRRGVQRYRTVINQSVRTTQAISATVRITAV